jgi:protoporphyrinogen/coproporphyrinogen III oxidase
MVFDTIVIGAGISGLAVAHGLEQRGRTVAVLEAAPQAGGVIATTHRDGALYERGPNSTLDTSPRIAQLLAELGIASERADAAESAAIRYIVRDGRLKALPTSPPAFLKTTAFSLRAKLRLMREPFIAPTPPGVEESIAAFVRRRLGNEFLDYAIDPFVAGIYAGDPDRISVKAAFPRLLALEQKYGSLIKGQFLGARERRRNKEVAKNAAKSFSFRAGMQTLTDALARRLAHLECGVRVRRVTRGPDGFVVEGTRGGDAVVFTARSVVIAAPAFEAGGIVAELAPEAGRALASVAYAPVAIVISTYARADVAHSLTGFGFLVPKVEHRALLGTLFSSSMFDGRAPDGTVLLTTFVGGRRNPEVLALSDDALKKAVHTELADLVGARAAPAWQEIVRWPKAIPQYDLGHLDRLRPVEAAEAAVPGLHFFANYRGGVSVGDRIQHADTAAAQVDAFLGARTPAPAPAAR